MSAVPRILIVDDEPEIRELIETMLATKIEAQFVHAASGNEAIRLINESPPFDCVISDYAMPDGTGEDLLRHLIAREAGTPFILVTAHPVSHITLFREHRPAALIMKPGIFIPLVKAVQESLTKVGAIRPAA